MLRPDQHLLIQAELLSTGADAHYAANLRAAYRGAADVQDRELFAVAEIELRRWVAKALQRRQRCGMFCPADCPRTNCPLTDRE